MKRKGFTLIELLVVIAIIGILLSLLLPAIHRVRDTAWRVGCANNLKQLALSCHMYEGDRGTFPPGVINLYTMLPEPPGYGSFYNRMPWSVHLLPYIDQGALYSSFDLTTYPLGTPGAVVGIPTYNCHADLYANRVYNTYACVMSYQGVNGTDQGNRDGVLCVNRVWAIQGITDGVSNTLLIGERPGTSDGWYGWWIGGYGVSPYLGIGDVVLGVTEILTFNPKVSETFRPRDGLSVYSDLLHYWSWHYGGANFAMCDGSVVFLRYDSQVLLPLATADKGD